MANTRELSQLASLLVVNDETKNIGIGTTNPTSKLHVVGDVKVTGIITASSFSGDGSGLTGIGVTRSLTIGSRSTAYVVNIVGTGVTLSLRSGIGTASF